MKRTTLLHFSFHIGQIILHQPLQTIFLFANSENSNPNNDSICLLPLASSIEFCTTLLMRRQSIICS